MRPLLILISPLYKKHYIPEQELSLDESMIKSKGKIFFPQFLPAKPVHFRIEQFALCESSTGYTLKLLVYVGSEMLAIVDNSLPMTEKVVVQLMQRYQQSGHTV